MRVLILGGTGRALTREARDRGHDVTAFVRSPQKLGAFADHVTVRRGDPGRVGQLRAILPGHDAVLPALGPPRTGSNDGSSHLCTQPRGRDANRRSSLVSVVSAAVLFEDLGILGTLMRWTLLKNVAEDSAEMERIVTTSGLDWTIVRPPRLTNGPLTGRYQVERGHLPGRSATASISRADVAHFVLE